MIDVKTMRPNMTADSACRMRAMMMHSMCMHNRQYRG